MSIAWLRLIRKFVESWFSLTISAVVLIYFIRWLVADPSNYEPLIGVIASAAALFAGLILRAYPAADEEKRLDLGENLPRALVRHYLAHPDFTHIRISGDKDKVFGGQ